MAKEEDYYKEIGASISEAEESQMFGKPALKVDGKAFACYFKECMVFKLGGTDHEEAMKLKGAQLFDPSGKGRAMKEWVQVPFAHKAKWKAFAGAALAYVRTSKK
jgi:hypothetical protein